MDRKRVAIFVAMVVLAVAIWSFIYPAKPRPAGCLVWWEGRCVIGPELPKDKP